MIDGHGPGTRKHVVANPGEFRQVVADVLDMPLATVISFDRLLAEGGYRLVGGRGRGAPKMRERDGSCLLTAIMASAQVKDAVQSVERYSATRLHRSTSTPGGYSGCGIAEFESLPKDHSFVDALEAVILWIVHGASRAGVEAGGSWTSGVPIIEVMAATPSTIGDIRISGIGDSVLAIRYTLPALRSEGHSGQGRIKGLVAWEAASRAHAMRSDLEQFRRISGRTLFQLGEVLADDD